MTRAKRQIKSSAKKVHLVRADGATVTKQDIVDRLADGIGLPRTDVLAVVDGFLSLVVDAVAGGQRVELRRFGVWKSVQRKGRHLRTPDGEHEVDLPDRAAAVFTPSSEFRQRVAEQAADKDS
jgi:nucleoid DNA-binding protein